jgi:hypothetical protein
MPGEIETAHNFLRDILRGILRPMFGGVECDDADRVAVASGGRSRSSNLITRSLSALPYL